MARCCSSIDVNERYSICLHRRCSTCICRLQHQHLCEAEASFTLSDLKLRNEKDISCLFSSASIEGRFKDLGFHHSASRRRSSPPPISSQLPLFMAALQLLTPSAGAKWSRLAFRAIALPGIQRLLTGRRVLGAISRVCRFANCSALSYIVGVRRSVMARVSDPGPSRRWLLRNPC